jgi:hypothetical protein
MQFKDSSVSFFPNIPPEEEYNSSIDMLASFRTCSAKGFNPIQNSALPEGMDDWVNLKGVRNLIPYSL